MVQTESFYHHRDICPPPPPSPIHITMAELAEQLETNLIEVKRTPIKRESAYIVDLKYGADPQAFIRRFREAHPDGPGARIEGSRGMSFHGTFDDETLHFLRSSPDVKSISEVNCNNSLFGCEVGSQDAVKHLQKELSQYQITQKQSDRMMNDDDEVCAFPRAMRLGQPSGRR
ncbi:hypothetical protein DFP72DRAFT_1100805 [Ephemerocybe angulata]|uniref:Uncharacterized protein n=1 Tax=Ephemerocybe angulata TaxID=980116 RepID=A0A8H6I8G7_9AGAR|nr:hypothetical protein DFP72DRAFT_1100805 [Tulosesus angulatus]